MNETFTQRIQQELDNIKKAGLFKTEHIITSQQNAEIIVDGKKVLNFCANNYLGLAAHSTIIEAAKKTMDTHGYGMSSVRFICGTQDIHKTLEQKIAQFLGTEDYQVHKKKRFPKADYEISIAENEAFLLSAPGLKETFKRRYEKTKKLYYKGQPPFEEILDTIHKNIGKL